MSEGQEGFEITESMWKSTRSLLQHSYVKIQELEKKIQELESGKPPSVWDCMLMDSKEFEKRIDQERLPHLKPSEIRAVRIYQHREECKSRINGISDLFILRTHDTKIKTMLARYENGIAPLPKAIVQAMKAVVINHPLYEGKITQSSNDVTVLRTEDNMVVFRRNRQLIHPQGVGSGSSVSRWFVGGPYKSESLLVFKDQNNYVDVEEKYARLFEFPINRGETPMVPPSQEV